MEKRFDEGEYVIAIDPLTLQEWSGKIITRLDNRQVVLNEDTNKWKFVENLTMIRKLDEADQQINTFNDYVNSKVGAAIDNGTNYNKIKPEDLKKLSKSFFDATRKNHEIKDRPSTEDEALKTTQNAIAAKTLEKENGDDVAAKEAEKNIEEINAKLKEDIIKDLNPNARKLVESSIDKYKDLICSSIQDGQTNKETPKENIENTIYEVKRQFPDDNIDDKELRDYVSKKVYEINPNEEEGDKYTNKELEDLFLAHDDVCFDEDDDLKIIKMYNEQGFEAASKLADELSMKYYPKN